MIKVKMSSIFVADQKLAEDFYTNKLGFVKKVDEPAGEFRWLTVGNSDSEFELSLEPNALPAARQYQESIFSDGIPATMFFVQSIDLEYERLVSLGVEFQSPPKKYGESKICAFNDTCGNWIMLCQEKV